jgi:hypothetical protein
MCAVVTVIFWVYECYNYCVTIGYQETSSEDNSVDVVTVEITICDYYALFTKYSVNNITIIDTFANE